MAETLPIVVPVRYSGGGLTMQSTSSRLSAEGVFVRGVVTPKQGALVSLQLTLPSGPRPVEARGTVTERVSPGDRGKEAGFWVRFDTISGDGNAVLAALIRDRSSGGAAKRAFERIPAHLKVTWPSAREFLVTYAENISAGGIYVVTPTPPELGEVVDISLELPDGPAPARTKAAVIQRLTPDEAKKRGRQPGAGLQFVGSDDEFRRRLDLCIENLLARPV